MKIVNPMVDAPRDGSRILLYYYAVGYFTGTKKRIGPKWEECLWVGDSEATGSGAYWKPWCGSDKTTTTERIDDDDAIAWVPIPIDVDTSKRKAQRGGVFLFNYLCGFGSGSVGDAVIAYLRSRDCSPVTRRRIYNECLKALG